ncbi:TetR/AcrR family transcriptional regulator [Nocardia vulneris]|uniref:TetR family transcriptional regulator n=1 Tax=Nocardia vulneris TaxID=1141657 RepID=A0ABR4ZE75_9NOCA|nr:TetR/AcrR family transcriptional regulator [Nocardia vulneris]KIA63672.1 TetR family transcriptional regulator [Nocardia vulneris]
MVESKSSRTYDGVLVAERRAERRTQFLIAGLAVYGTEGYTSSTIAMVCKRAGLARAQFYEHFENREDLLLAVYDMVQADARSAAAAAVEAAPEGDFLARARAAMQAYANAVGSDPNRARVSYVEVVGVSARVEQHRIDQREIWVQFFIDELKQNLGSDFVPPGGYRAAATGFIGALMALVHQWSISEPRTDLAAATEVLTAFLVGLVRR